MVRTVFAQIPTPTVDTKLFFLYLSLQVIEMALVSVNTNAGQNELVSAINAGQVAVQQVINQRLFIVRKCKTFCVI